MNSDFVPKPDNDKVIFVRGWDESEITRIIGDFVAMYENDGYPAYTIEPKKQSEKFYRLTFPQDVHPRLFIYLLNYVAYPFDFELRNRSIIVGGKTTLNADFEGLDPQLLGKNAILYIPENDEERTVVYMRTESGVTLAHSFVEIKWKRVDQARLSSDVKKLVEGS